MANNNGDDQSDIKFPINTLVRILKEEALQAPDKTKITKQAVEGLSQYLDVFVKEAIWRSYKQLEQEQLQGQQGEMALDIDQLRAVSSNLVLDFL